MRNRWLSAVIAVAAVIVLAGCVSWLPGAAAGPAPNPSPISGISVPGSEWCTDGADEEQSGYCETPSAEPGDGGSIMSDTDQMVIVVFVAKDDSQLLQIFNALGPVEEDADNALEASGVGYIDGNDVGAGEYESVFMGSDAHQVWALIKPIYDRAAFAWSRVELYKSADGEPTEVIPHP